MAFPANLRLPHTMERAATEFTWWCLRPGSGHKLEYVRDPEYWVDILQDRLAIKQYDRVTVIAEDGSYCVDLMFMEIDERRLWAKTRVLQVIWDDSDTERPAIKDGSLRVEWGGAHKWRVMTADGNLIEKGFATEDEANRYLAQYREQKAAA